MGNEAREPEGSAPWQVDDFPLWIFYFPRPNMIEVIRILHHAKDIKAILDKL